MGVRRFPTRGKVTIIHSQKCMRDRHFDICSSYFQVRVKPSKSVTMFTYVRWACQRKPISKANLRGQRLKLKVLAKENWKSGCHFRRTVVLWGKEVFAIRLAYLTNLQLNRTEVLDSGDDWRAKRQQKCQEVHILFALFCREGKPYWSRCSHCMVS